MKKLYYAITDFVRGLIYLVMMLVADPQNLEKNRNEIQGRDKTILVRFTIIFCIILSVLLVSFDIRLIRL